CNWNLSTIDISCTSAKSTCFSDDFSDSTSGQFNNHNDHTGINWGNGYTGPEDVYEFVTAGGAVTFTLTNLSDDLDLIIRDGCSSSSNYIDGSYGQNTTDETVTVTLPTGTYYIFVEGWDGAESAYTLSIDCAGIYVRPKVLLQGALQGAMMSDDLRSTSLLPSADPYNSSGGAVESISSSLLAITGDDAIVDWVVVELRTSLSLTTVAGQQSALVQRDGDVVATDGVSPVTFPGVPTGDYYVVIKHRNHLSVMTANPVSLD
ncbi:MAG: PPC domain-containing protein, partial [Bacteroidota bacterium]